MVGAVAVAVAVGGGVVAVVVGGGVREMEMRSFEEGRTSEA